MMLKTSHIPSAIVSLFVFSFQSQDFNVFLHVNVLSHPFLRLLLISHRHCPGMIWDGTCPLLLAPKRGSLCSPLLMQAGQVLPSVPWNENNGWICPWRQPKVINLLNLYGMKTGSRKRAVAMELTSNPAHVFTHTCNL